MFQRVAVGNSVEPLSGGYFEHLLLLPSGSSSTIPALSSPVQKHITLSLPLSSGAITRLSPDVRWARRV